MSTPEERKPTPKEVPDYIVAIGDDVYFDAVHYWIEGDYFPAVLIATLRDNPKLADVVDSQGNTQSSVRLDIDTEEPDAGYWATVPTGVTQDDLDQSAKGYDAKYAEMFPPVEPSP